MTHSKFLQNLMLSLAATLAACVFLVLSTGASTVAVVATCSAILFASVGSIYYFDGGGYCISEKQLKDTVNRMRG